MKKKQLNQDQTGNSAKISVADFLKVGFLYWEQIETKKKTYTEFSNWLGISVQQVNHYMKGIREPNPITARKIANKLGPKIFAILGLRSPDENLEIINNKWPLLPNETQQKILAIINETIPAKEPDYIFKLGDQIITKEYPDNV